MSDTARGPITTGDQGPRNFRTHIGGWAVYRNSRGWPRWYQRWLEAWWIINGKWSLHRAWQNGHDHGTQMEYRRIIVNGGDLVPLYSALDESIKLQSHYAGLLNDYDGGHRLQFQDRRAWMKRLAEIGRLPGPPDRSEASQTQAKP